MRWLLLSFVFLCGCSREENVEVPLSPGGILPRDMNARQWSEFVSQSGIQADRRVKTFTPTWTGFSADPTGDISYMDFGAIVVMWNDTGADIVGTSNATTMSLTGVPEVIRPGSDLIGPTLVMDSSGVWGGQFSMNTTGGLGFARLYVDGVYLHGGDGVTFTAAGSKGLPAGWLITYAK